MVLIRYGVGFVVGGVLSALFTPLKLYYCGCHLHCRRPKLYSGLVAAGLPATPTPRSTPLTAHTFAENEFSAAKNAAATKYKEEKETTDLILGSKSSLSDSAEHHGFQLELSECGGLQQTG
jgi:hypothetical protein